MLNNKHVPPLDIKRQSSFAMLSMILGIFSLVCVCFPPLQLVLGGLAIMFALLAKTDADYNGQSLIGLFIGTLSCITSFVIFWQFLNNLEMIKQDPDQIALLNKAMNDLEQMTFQFLEMIFGVPIQ